MAEAKPARAKAAYAHTIGGRVYRFDGLKTLLAKASAARSGDFLAGVAAATDEERMAARLALAEPPLRRFLDEAVVPYEADEVTRLIVESHDAAAFNEIALLTVGDFRNWLLSPVATTEALARVAPGITPEMAAAVSKPMRNQDLILAPRKCGVVTRFRNTLGLPGHERRSRGLPGLCPGAAGAGRLRRVLPRSGQAYLFARFRDRLPSRVACALARFAAFERVRSKVAVRVSLGVIRRA